MIPWRICPYALLLQLPPLHLRGPPSQRLNPVQDRQEVSLRCMNSHHASSGVPFVRWVSSVFWKMVSFASEVSVLSIYTLHAPLQHRALSKKLYLFRHTWLHGTWCLCQCRPLFLLAFQVCPALRVQSGREGILSRHHGWQALPFPVCTHGNVHIPYLCMHTLCVYQAYWLIWYRHVHRMGWQVTSPCQRQGHTGGYGNVSASRLLPSDV